MRSWTWKFFEKRRRTLQGDRDEVRLGIEKNRDEYTVSRLCSVLSVSRSGYCQGRVRPPSDRALANQALDVQVAAIHRDSRRSYRR
ncbi:MAG: hypothetical protein JWR60_3864, partial [Polaromonas sp.]|nr:hypothetical protein [Polaromonas sp.]